MLYQQTALISGASSGIGLALTKELLLSYPFIQIVALCRNPETLQQLKRSYGDRVRIECIDFTNRDCIKSLQNVVNQHTHFSYLIHCAGVVMPFGDISNVAPDEWEATQWINVEVPRLLTQICLKKFSHSRVMFLTSDLPVQPVAGASAYCVSKASLNMLCQCFQLEVDNDIAVFTTVAPGNVDTKMQETIRQASNRVLPASELMRSMFSANKLLPPRLVAQYLRQLLSDVTPNTFGSRSWNLLESIVEVSPAKQTKTDSIDTRATETSLVELASLVGGAFWSPGSAEYEENRKVFNQGVSRFPLVIIQPKTKTDIIHIVKCAKQLRLSITIKGQGHGVSGMSVLNNAIVIDMSMFKTTVLNVDKSSVNVGAGVKNSELDHFLAQHNKVVPLGTCPDVGVVGATLGGGIGFLSRKLGLSCDNVLAFGLITADGKVRQVTESQHPDLFWALKGCGHGQFGVVTDVTFKLNDAPQNIDGRILEWPLCHARSILRQYSKTVLSDNRSVFLYAYLSRSTHDKARISIMGFSEDSVHGLDSVAKWQDGATLLSRRSQYVECQSNDYDSDLSLYWRNGIIEGELSDEFIETLLSCYRACPVNSGGFMLDPLCGAIQDVNADDSAFIHRNASFVCSITGITQAECDDTEVIDWVNKSFDLLLPFFNGHSYQNYDMGNGSPLALYYGQHTARLKLLKQQYDPTGLFMSSLLRPD